MPDNNNGFTFFKDFRKGSDTSYAYTGSEPNGDTKRSPKISKAKAKWLQKMTWEVNKFPYSRSRELGLYSFQRSELEWYYKEIRALADKILDLLECPYCEDTIKKAVLPGCGCKNPLACCSKCWLEAGSKCPNCKRQCTSDPFESVDDIIHECHLFYKEKGFHKGMKCAETEIKRITESYYRFLKQSEMELMCMYCFGPLEKTMTVNRESGRKALCLGCHEMYMESYPGNEPFPYPTFDRLCSEYKKFFDQILFHCVRNKLPVYRDPLPPVSQPNHFKRLGLKRIGVRGKLRRFSGFFKKAVFVAACAYLVSYFVN